METAMIDAVEVKALPGYRIWIKFADNRAGELDLSHLAGKGVFAAWNDTAVFNAVFIDPVCHAVAWPGDIQICRDSLYEQLTGIGIAAPLATHA